MKKILCWTLSLLLIVTLGTFGSFTKLQNVKAATGTGLKIAVNVLSTSSLAIDPGNTKLRYVGGKNGLFKSLDGGGTWTAIGTTLTSPEVKKIIINPVTPTTLYVVDYAIDRSIDGGLTWTNISGSFVNPRTTDLVLDPKNPSILYACATTYLNYMQVPKPGGIWRSTDGGATWTAITKGLTSLWVQTLAIDSLNPTTLYAGTKDKGIFRSLDSGATWLAINKNFIGWEGNENSGNIIALAVNPTDPNILYAGDNINGIYRSRDGGDNWQQLAGFERMNFLTSITLNPTTPTTIYAGTELAGAFKSEDGGDTWENLATEFINASARVFAFALKPSNFLYMGNSEGLYNYTEGPEVTPKQTNVMVLKLATATFFFNGRTGTLDTPPIIKNGRTLLPISAVIQAFGGTVAWTAVEQKVTLVLDPNKLELWIGKNLALLNGASVKLDATNAAVVPEIINSRTMLPVRFVAEHLGGTVVWAAEEKTITITLLK